MDMRIGFILVAGALFLWCMYDVGKEYKEGNLALMSLNIGFSVIYFLLLVKELSIFDINIINNFVN